MFRRKKNMNCEWKENGWRDEGKKREEWKLQCLDKKEEKEERNLPFFNLIRNKEEDLIFFLSYPHPFSLPISLLFSLFLSYAFFFSNSNRIQTTRNESIFLQKKGKY